MPLEYNETIHDEIIRIIDSGSLSTWATTSSTITTYSQQYNPETNRSVLVKKEIAMATLAAKPAPAQKITNQNVIRALREFKNLREQRDETVKLLRARFAAQTICGTTYKREFKTVAQYKAAVALRRVMGPLNWAYNRLQAAYMAVPVPASTVELLQNAFSSSTGGYSEFNATSFRHYLDQAIAQTASTDNYARDNANTLIRRMVPYVCPLTGKWLLSLQRDYGRHYTGPLQELVDAGAVKDGNGKWYRSAAERAEALQLREVLMLYRGDFVKRELPAAEIAAGGMRKTKDGREVLVVPGSVAIAEYHSGLEDTSYDDAPRHVGIELEVNAGKHSSGVTRNDLAAQILLATNRRVKVERDGSITGFEVITGHGKPSSVRQELAEVFRQKLLTGFRTARTTGAHVHVTALEGEARKVRDSESYYTALLPFYSALAERTPTHHCRAGMHNGRYSALNYETGKGTVEFRLFRSQLKLPKLIRNAQFGWAFMELLGQFVPGSDDETIRNRFLEGLADLPREETLELRAWMAGRGHKVPHTPTDLRRVYRNLGVSAAMG